MTRSACRGLFVTGTDTDAGKTYVSALLIRHLRDEGWNVGACKPAVSGAVQRPVGECQPAGEGGSPAATSHGDECWIWSDAEILREACGLNVGDEAARRIATQRFREPLAPPMAARREGRNVSWQAMLDDLAWWLGRVDRLLIEGVGGLLCPLTDRHTVADLVGTLGCPVLVVARAELGTINHTLLTVEAARRRALPLAGIVINQTSPATDAELIAGNIEEIERRTGVPVRAFVSYGASRLPEPRPDGTIRWADLFGPFGQRPN